MSRAARIPWYGANESGLRVRDLTSKSIKTLTTGSDNFPAWSPSGDRIEVVNPLYKRATGAALPRAELRPLLNSLYEWPMFLMGYGCAIYQRAVQEQGYGHNRNPGHLDLWSATYLPVCDVFVTRDKRQRRALKILNKANPRLSQILSYAQLRQRLVGTPL